MKELSSWSKVHPSHEKQQGHRRGKNHREKREERRLKIEKRRKTKRRIKNKNLKAIKTIKEKTLIDKEARIEGKKREGEKNLTVNPELTNNQASKQKLCHVAAMPGSRFSTHSSFPTVGIVSSQAALPVS